MQGIILSLFLQLETNILSLNCKKRFKSIWSVTFVLKTGLRRAKKIQNKWWDIKEWDYSTLQPVLCGRLLSLYKVKESVLLLHGDKRTATFSCVVTYLKAPQQIERYKNLVEPIPPPPPHHGIQLKIEKKMFKQDSKEQISDSRF